MKAREEILSKLRRQIVDQTTLPEIDAHDGFITFEDPKTQLKNTVEMVGGSCTELADPHDLLRRLQLFPQFSEARRIFSNVADVPGNVDLDSTADPHDLEDLDFVIYKGDFAVAENGAVWITNRSLKHRVIFFITQFLVLVVDRESIVDNMHQAYERLEVPSPGFGLFLSGPSKTADIEQSLVIGAHGCREMQLYLV